MSKNMAYCVRYRFVLARSKGALMSNFALVFTIIYLVAIQAIQELSLSRFSVSDTFDLIAFCSR